MSSFVRRASRRSRRKCRHSEGFLGLPIHGQIDRGSQAYRSGDVFRSRTKPPLLTSTVQHRLQGCACPDEEHTHAPRTVDLVSRSGQQIDRNLGDVHVDLSDGL